MTNTEENKNEEITSEQRILLLLGNIDALETEIELLKNENEVLNDRIESLESILKQKTQTA